MTCPTELVPDRSRYSLSECPNQALPWFGVGLAFGPSASRIASRYPELVDYLEVPFELLASTPNLLRRTNASRILLHSASLSVGGNCRLKRRTVEAVRKSLAQTRSPWLSEHLAFVEASALDEPASSSDRSYHTGFTIAPPMNKASVDLISRRLNSLSSALEVPLLVENSPLYYSIPNSTLDPTDFLNEILEKTTADLLLDLTHLVISARNLGFSPASALLRLPASRIRQIHLSGIEYIGGTALDHHASAIPQEVLSLVPIAMAGKGVRAVTLEYNWISDFSDREVLKELRKVRKLVDQCRAN